MMSEDLSTTDKNLKELKKQKVKKLKI